MAGIDGLEVLRQVRAHPELGHTPVILVTAYGEREPRLRALELGVDDFLEKPIDTTALCARITTLLRLKMARDDLAQRHDALQRLQREQREVLDVLVNDVAATIGSLQTSTDWLDVYADAGSGAVREAVAEVQSKLARLTALVHDLSWVAWLDASTFPVCLTNVHVDRLAADVAESFERASQTRNVELDVTVAPPVVVRADARLLRRVLENLLDNAIRHTPKGGRVRIEVRDADRAEVRVCNEGPPIDEDSRRRIFDKFARVPAESMSLGHPGLGLYFCRRALEVQCAEIAVVDQPGWSVAFAVRFHPRESGAPGDARVRAP
jgi:signal transduction histidine kinase